jgi:hypothetical protein
LDDFSLSRYSKSGRQPYCRECDRDRKGKTRRYPDTAPEGHKTCTRCGEVKLLANYYLDGRGRLGRTSRCRDCIGAADERRRRSAGVPERPRFADGGGHKWCRKCRQRLPVESFAPEPRNSDGLRSWCTPCVNARTLEWHRANPATIQALKALHREAAESNAVTERDWARLLARWDYCCAYCGVGGKRLSWEHVVPLTRGGRHTIGNVLPICRSCNSSKGNRLLAEWRYRTRRRAVPGAFAVLLPLADLDR